MDDTGVLVGGSGRVGTAPELNTQVSTQDVIRPRQYMTVSGIHAPVDEGISASEFDYEKFSVLAGPLTHPRSDQPYRVQYRRIDHGKREWLFTRLIAASLVALDLRSSYWLVFESQYPDVSGWMWRSGVQEITTDAHIALLVFMALGSIVMQLFLLMNVVTVSRSCLAARDPIPVAPDPRLRVAFITTIVPDKEPIAMAERTLRAAKEIVYRGQLDVWLLDEGDSAEVRSMCSRLGIHHFSRKGRGDLEFSSGTFAAKTKHGNHNRWLWEHAREYDVVMFVDTDHVPLPIMAE